MRHLTINDGISDCKNCKKGNVDVLRLIAHSTIQGKRHLLHMHKNEDFECLLTRLCATCPEEWKPKVMYYIYVNMGGIYYPIESASWIRDKDHLLVTTIADVSDIPDIDMNAVHAKLRDGVKLLPHQQAGVQRMIEMEQSPIRGGILADEMGLGKTLQVLTTMIQQQPKLDVQAKTLIVVPTHGVAHQWAEEIRLKTRFGGLPYFIYDEHTKFLIEQPCFKVVITTYDRLRSEYYRKFSNSKHSPLFDTHWFRVVLDESNKMHDIKSKLAVSILTLEASFRWCVTGTPLQNSASELHPIFEFLRIDLPVSKRSNLVHLSQLLGKHMIRRKVNQVEIDSWQDKTEFRVVLEFTPPERALYDYLEYILFKQLHLDKKKRKLKGEKLGSPLLYLRLKQACNHHLLLLNKFPDLIPMATMNTENQVASVLQSMAIPGVSSRGSEGRKLNSELEQVRDIIKDFYGQYRPSPPNMDELEKLPFIPHSTKVSWLIDFLNKSLKKSPSDKIVVVSQFTELLALISDHFKKIKIRHESYTGDMKAYQRQRSLERFNVSPKCQVLLLALKAGGVGLNLQRANHMVLLDRWWNPAVMDQVVARIHRMKQTKRTFIHTVIMKDTLEEGLMDSVLDKKITLFESVVDPLASRWTKNGKTITEIHNELDLDEELVAAAEKENAELNRKEVMVISDDDDDDDDDDSTDDDNSIYTPARKRNKQSLYA